MRCCVEGLRRERRGCEPGRLALKTLATIMKKANNYQHVCSNVSAAAPNHTWLEGDGVCNNNPSPPARVFKYGSQSNTLVTAYWLRFLEKKRYAGSPLLELFDPIWPIIHVWRVRIVCFALAWFPSLSLEIHSYQSPEKITLICFLIIQTWLLYAVRLKICGGGFHSELFVHPHLKS